MNFKNMLKNSWRNLAFISSATLLGLVSYQIVDESKLYREKRQVYDNLLNQAIVCIRDGNPGLSHQEEIAKLYLRAGVNPDIDFRPRTRQAGLPIIPREKLEEVVQNCETDFSSK